MLKRYIEMQKDLSAAEEAATVECSGLSVVGAQVTGTYTGNLVFEVSVNGTTWETTYVKPQILGNSLVNVTAGTGIFLANVAGIAWFRVRCSAYTSGTAEVSLLVTDGDPAALVFQATTGEIEVLTAAT